MTNNSILTDNSIFIRTFKKGMINLTSITPDDILIDDIAYGLSHVNRFGGQTYRPYSVLEHSLLSQYLFDIHYTTKVYENLKNKDYHKISLMLLLHDASEAYIGDVIRPLKYSSIYTNSRYAEYENKIMQAINAKYKITTDDYNKYDSYITKYDNIALKLEETSLYRDLPKSPFQNFHFLNNFIIVNGFEYTEEQKQKLNEKLSENYYFFLDCLRIAFFSKIQKCIHGLLNES